MKMDKPPLAYDAASIVVLPGLEAVRKNPGMYIGSADGEGLHQLAYEIIYNSIDEFTAGHCRRIGVALEKDGSCVIEDDGRGIPVEPHAPSGKPACEVVLTTLHSGGKFTPGSYSRAAGLHGVGLSCVNALSERLTLDVRRGGKHYRQAFARGVAASGLETVGTAKGSGTRIAFLPDPAIFKDALLSGDILAQRLEELAYLHPGLLIQFEDRCKGESKTFQSKDGLLEFASALCGPRKPIHDGAIRIGGRRPDAEFDLALQWTLEYQETVRSYVNSVSTVYGGTHVAAVKSAVTRAVNDHAREANLVKANEPERITAFDVLEGLVCVLSVNMDHPVFEGQTKKRLMSPDVREWIEESVLAGLRSAFRTNPRLAYRIVQRALDATRARAAARRASEDSHYHFLETGEITEEVYKKQFGARSRNWHESAAWITDSGLLSRHAEHFSLGRNARVLDVCCGSGVVGAAFKGKAASVEGLDLTPEMIQLAKTRLDKVHQGTVYALPFADNTYDAVVTREVLHLLPAPEKPVSEIFRVLKPGGQFIVGHILPFGAEDAAWMYRIFKKKQPLTFTMFQEEDFRRLLQGAGFTDLKMSEYRLWESIDVWIDSYETSPLHRQEIRDLFHNAPQEAKAVHPFEVLPSGEIRDLWRWCIFSARKPA